MATATITIPVQTFNELSTGLLCPIGTMTVSGDSRVTIVSGVIKVKPVSTNTEPLTLAFTLSGLDNSYNIAGVVFGGAGSSSVFTAQAGNSSGTVSVADALGTQGNWELYVIVQKGSGGKIGVIDPPIENDQA